MLIKALSLGDSGSGKSGSLASLAIAGYNIHVLDYDGSMSSANALTSVLEEEPEALARVRWKSIQDKIKFIQGKPALVRPCTAYREFGKTLEEWGAENFTEADVLVLDTLTSFSDAGFNEACSLAGKMGLSPDGSDHPRPAEYGWMADSVKLAMEILTSAAVPCHVIVNTHVKVTATEEEKMTVERNKIGAPTEPFTRVIGQPNARGQEIPRIVARYFNNVFYYTRQGSKRVITTQPQGIVDVKTSRIKDIKRFYSIETGLAELFADLGATPPLPRKSPSELANVNATAKEA